MRFPFQLPPEREFDCAGFGENTVDYILSAARFPVSDTKLELDDARQLAGGQIASMLVGLQRLGLRTTYAGRFGADAAGAFGFNSLAAEGVDTRHAEQIADARTHASYIIVDRTNNSRTILWQRDAQLDYAIEDAPHALAAAGRVLHVDAHDAAATLRLMRAAQARGTIVSADFDRVDAGVVSLLEAVDVLVTSAEFPRLLTGADDERAALMRLQERAGSFVVGMTRGERGAMLYCAGEFIETPALPVPGGVRDTTGAGDAFHAGFLYGLLEGADIETSLRYAAAVAALKCRLPGAQAGLPTSAELEEYLRRH